MADDRSDRLPFPTDASSSIDRSDADAGAPADRRRAPRLAITRRCKIFEPRARRYVAAETRDLSAGGMCLRLDGPVPLEPGDRIHVGLTALGPSELLRQAEMHESRVMWIDVAADGRTMIGLAVEADDQAVMYASAAPRLAA